MNSRTLTASALFLGVWSSLGCPESSSSLYLRQQADVRYRKAETLLEAGDEQAALEKLLEAVRFNPKHAEAFTAIGDIHRTQNHLDLARINYEAACRADPEAFRPHFFLGVTYQRLAEHVGDEGLKHGYLRKAAILYARASTLEMESFDAHLNLGACYFYLDQYELAEQHTYTAWQLNPRSYAACNNLGIIYQAQGKLQEAVMAYKASLEMNSDQPIIILYMGYAFSRSGKFNSALATFSTAARRMPDNPEPWEQIGLCYFHRKKLDKALRSFQEALRRDPRSAPAYRGFGTVCLYQFVRNPERTDLKEIGLDAWRRSLRLQPAQADLQRLLDRYTTTVTAQAKK
jgi:tetratricopeptide (TPR) repeat protein